jgi:hypothetical protein
LITDDFEHDEILKRLGAEDPSSRWDETHPELPGERDAVRARATALLEDTARRPSRKWILSSIRPRLALAAVFAVLAIGVGLSLFGGGSGSGPARALAIDKGQRWVTLTIRNPEASDGEMNQDLADAGIDRVRVRSVPGPPPDVGTWAGYAEFGPYCQGGVSRFGFGVDIPSKRSTAANRHRAKGLFEITVPRHSGALTAAELGDAYSGSTLRINADSVDDPRYSAKVLVPVHARRSDDRSNANEIGPGQLVALGGVFAQYGRAYEDGTTHCSDFGLKPPPTPSLPAAKEGVKVCQILPIGQRGGFSRKEDDVVTQGRRNEDQVVFGCRRNRG